MKNYLKIIAPVLLIPFVLYSQTSNEMKTSIDSLEQSQIELGSKADSIQARLDSIHAVIRKELSKTKIIDTIVGIIADNCDAYQQPDITSKKKYRVKKEEIVVIIGFHIEWFKIIHKKGIGFILDDCIKHDDKIFNYKKMQELKFKQPQKE